MVVSYMSLSTSGLHAGALFELAKKANATAPIDCAPAPPTPQVRDTLAPQCNSPGSSGLMLAHSSTCPAGAGAAVQHSPAKLLMHVLQVASLLSQGQATMCQNAVHAIPSIQ